MQRGKQWLEKLLLLAELPSTVRAEFSPFGEEENNYWLIIDEKQLTPEQIQILIGPDGSVIDSIQYLINTILNLGREPEEQCSYTIELQGYRARRCAELRKMAEYVAKQVLTTGEEFEMKHLSAAERRQIHTILKEWSELKTESRGEEPDRRLVVRLRSR